MSGSCSTGGALPDKPYIRKEANRMKMARVLALVVVLVMAMVIGVSAQEFPPNGWLDRPPTGPFYVPQTPSLPAGATGDYYVSGPYTAQVSRSYTTMIVEADNYLGKLEGGAHAMNQGYRPGRVVATSPQNREYVAQTWHTTPAHLWNQAINIGGRLANSVNVAAWMGPPVTVVREFEQWIYDPCAMHPEYCRVEPGVTQ